MSKKCTIDLIGWVVGGFIGNPGNRSTLLWFQSGRTFCRYQSTLPDVPGIFSRGKDMYAQYAPNRTEDPFPWHSGEVME